jgi:hypothetical protein
MRRGLRGRRANGTLPPIPPVTIFGSSLVAAFDHRRRVVLGTGAQVVLARDHSRNGNDVINGTSLQQPIQGATGIDFDGSDDNLACASNGSLASGAALTIALRVTPDVATGNRVPFARSQSTSGSWSVQTNGTALRMHLGTPGTNFGEVASAIAASTERTYVWVFDGGGATNADKLRLWIDGVSQSVTFTGTIPTTVPASSNTLSLGCFSGPDGQYWDGKIKGAVMAHAVATTTQRTALEAYLGGL